MAGGSCVRAARADEIEGLAALAAAAGSPDAATGQLETVFREGRLLVAVEEGRVVGVAGLLHVAGACFVSDLFVAPSEQRRGHGQRLLAELLSDAAVCVTFSSHHPAARCLYERHGMREIGRLLYLGKEGRRRFVPDFSPLAAVLLDDGWIVEDDDLLMATPGWEWPHDLLEASPGLFWPDDPDAPDVGRPDALIP